MAVLRAAPRGVGRRRVGWAAPQRRGWTAFRGRPVVPRVSAADGGGGGGASAQGGGRCCSATAPNRRDWRRTSAGGGVGVPARGEWKAQEATAVSTSSSVCRWRSATCRRGGVCVLGTVALVFPLLLVGCGPSSVGGWCAGGRRHGMGSARRTCTASTCQPPTTGRRSTLVDVTASSVPAAARYFVLMGARSFPWTLSMATPTLWSRSATASSGWGISCRR